jgi:hypothetical protein
MALTHKNLFICGFIILMLARTAVQETIQIAPTASGNLFNSMQSTWNSAALQKQQFNNIFPVDSFFNTNSAASKTGVGNNVIQGSNNQMQGVNNKVSGQNNSLIGMNTTIVGDLNKAFGLSNTIFGNSNEIVKGNNNQIKGS